MPTFRGRYCEYMSMRHTVSYMKEIILCNQKHATFGVPKSRWSLSLLQRMLYMASQALHCKTQGHCVIFTQLELHFQEFCSLFDSGQSCSQEKFVQVRSSRHWTCCPAPCRATCTVVACTYYHWSHGSFLRHGQQPGHSSSSSASLRPRPGVSIS